MLTLDDIEEVETEETGIVEYPPVVVGRVAHIDADFLAHMVSYERDDEVVSLDDCQYRATTMVLDKMRMVAAEYAILHITDQHSDKGGRYEAAIQRVYQEQRKNTPRPRYLNSIKSFLGGYTSSNISGKIWKNAEADDGMSEVAWKAWYDCNIDNCVIVTKDKDLRMCPCVHADWDTGELYYPTDTFGFIEIVKGPNGKTNKPRGYGTKFFWWQMLMGDIADNIQGCPKVKWSKKLRWNEPNLKACGIVSAYNILKDIDNDFDAMKTVIRAYKTNATKFYCGPDITWKDILKSEARLLWMQRTAGKQEDVLDWMKEIKHAY